MASNDCSTASVWLQSRRATRGRRSLPSRGRPRVRRRDRVHPRRRERSWRWPGVPTGRRIVNVLPPPGGLVDLNHVRDVPRRCAGPSRVRGPCPLRRSRARASRVRTCRRCAAVRRAECPAPHREPGSRHRRRRPASTTIGGVGGSTSTALSSRFHSARPSASRSPPIGGSASPSRRRRVARCRPRRPNSRDTSSTCRAPRAQPVLGGLGLHPAEVEQVLHEVLQPHGLAAEQP